MLEEPAPVVIFGYRRPRHLEKVLQALSDQDFVREALCIFYLDGPRNAGEQAEVDQVRVVARRNWGFRQVEIRASEKNQGLVRSITRGVTEVARDHGAAIVLEDDIVPRPGFLSFMNEALEKYRNSPQVMQISAYAYPVEPRPQHHSLLPLTSCWGWATWRRSWNQYGWDRQAAMADLANPDFVRKFDLGGAYPYSRLLQDVVAGKSDSWGVIWYWNVFRAEGLTLFPAHSLVDNIGWDGTGEHAAPNWKTDSEKSPIADGDLWPKTIQVHRDNLDRVCNLLSGKAGKSVADRQRGRT